MTEHFIKFVRVIISIFFREPHEKLRSFVLNDDATNNQVDSIAKMS